MKLTNGSSGFWDWFGSSVLLLEVQLLRVQASIFMGHLFSLYYESGHRHGDCKKDPILFPSKERNFVLFIKFEIPVFS